MVIRRLLYMFSGELHKIRGVQMGLGLMVEEYEIPLLRFLRI